MGSNARVLNVTGVADSQIFVGNASGEIKLYDCRNSSVFKLHDIGKEVNNYNLNYKKNLIACSTMDGIKKIALDGLIERDHQDFVGNVRCLKFVPFKDDCAYSTGSINIGFA